MKSIGIKYADGSVQRFAAPNSIASVISELAGKNDGGYAARREAYRCLPIPEYSGPLDITVNCTGLYEALRNGE